MKSVKYILTLLISLTLVNTSIFAADFVLKLAHNGPDQHPFQNGAERFKQVMEEETNGAVEVQIFPGEQLGSEEDTSQMIKQGTLACAVESAGGGLSPFVASADLFNLPFLRFFPLQKYDSEDVELLDLHLSQYLIKHDILSQMPLIS